MGKGWEQGLQSEHPGAAGSPGLLSQAASYELCHFEQVTQEPMGTLVFSSGHGDNGSSL